MVIGLSPASTDVAVAKAFRRKAKVFHPDKGGDSETFHKLGACNALIIVERKTARKT